MDTAIEPVGRGIGRDIASAAGEKAERQIDAFILHRHDKRVAPEGDREEEEAWKDTERRHIAARRERNRLRWKSTTKAKQSAWKPPSARSWMATDRRPKG
jgi:hypothetical protein